MTTQQTHHDLSNSALLEGLRAHLQPLAGDARQYDGLLALIGPARFALLGEASHGTHEFYRERAEITKVLITDQGFTAVAVEADWPDAWRVNRYVRGLSDDADADADAALSGFQRFPAWMWRNTVVREFVEWMRHHNTGLSPLRQVGFYGLDLYSLFSSIQAVLTYLDRLDPQAASRAPSTVPLRLLRPCSRRQPGLWLCRQLWPQGKLRGRGGAAITRNEPPCRRSATDAWAGA